MNKSTTSKTKPTTKTFGQLLGKRVAARKAPKSIAPKAKVVVVDMKPKKTLEVAKEVLTPTAKASYKGAVDVITSAKQKAATAQKMIDDAIATKTALTQEQMREWKELVAAAGTFYKGPRPERAKFKRNTKTVKAHVAKIAARLSASDKAKMGLEGEAHKAKKSATVKRAPSGEGYKGHRAGSLAATAHELIDNAKQIDDKLIASLVKIGLKENTAKQWCRNWFGK